MAVLNFFSVQKLNFGHFWNCSKKFREIDLFDFMIFFGLDFFKFFDPLWWYIILIFIFIYQCHFVNIKIYSISTNVVHYTMISLPLTLVYCMSRPSKFLDIIFVFLEVSTDKIRNCNCHKIVRGQIGNQILLIEFLWRKLCSFLSVCKRYLYSFINYRVTKLPVVQYYHYVLYVNNIFII